MTFSSRPPITAFPSDWIPLIDKLGSVAELARSLGVHPRTLRRWAQGARMRRPNLMALAALADFHSVQIPERREKIR